MGATHGMTQIRFDGCDLRPRLSTRAQAPRATVCNGTGQAGVAHPVARDDRDDDRRREFRRSRPAAYRRLDRSSALSPSHAPERLHGHLSTAVPRALSWSGGAERRFNPICWCWADHGGSPWHSHIPTKPTTAPSQDGIVLPNKSAWALPDCLTIPGVTRSPLAQPRNETPHKEHVDLPRRETIPHGVGLIVCSWRRFLRREGHRYGARCGGWTDALGRREQRNSG